MPQRLLQHLRHFITALGLLIVCLIGAELWLRARGPMPVPVVATQADLFDQRQLIPSATQHHQMRPLAEIRSDTIAFKTNSLGLRGPEPQIPPPAGTFRVLLLGDDAVVGSWLQAKHTLSQQLQQRLTKYLQRPVEVINGGVPGYSPVLNVLHYDHVLKNLEPDLVILHIDMSDVADEVVHRSSLRQDGSRHVCIHPALAQSAGPSHGLISLLRQSAVVHEILDGLAIKSETPQQSQRYDWTHSETNSVTQVRHTMDSVDRLRELTASHGRSLMITSSPVAWQVLSPAKFPELSRTFGVTGDQPVTRDVPFNILEAWGDSREVPVCKAVNAFRNRELIKTPEQLFRSDSARLSKYGTALHARELALKIRDTPAAIAGHSGRRLQ